MASLILDFMEYANDTAAQAAYVSDGLNDIYGSDILTGGTASASGDDGNVPANAADDDPDTYWRSNSSPNGSWWKYDLGVGATKIVRKLIAINNVNAAYFFGNFNLDGSNNDTDWTTIYSGNMDDLTSPRTFTFANTTAYRYYRVIGTSVNQSGTGTVIISEFEMMEANLHSLQSYSEATIKTQGSYSLKAVAVATDSLNKTLTKTLSPVSNLSGVKNLKFDIRSSRIGSNIKIGIHDSGGTTTEITPNILTADTWQTIRWDLSSVSDANKDTIDSIIVTIVNADAANTFYLDCAEIAQAIDVFGIIT